MLPSCLCRLTFQDCSDAFVNPGSTVAGASATGRVASIADARGTVPVAETGMPNGGLLAVLRTIHVPGPSTLVPYAARNTARAFAKLQTMPARGWKFRLFCL